MFPSTGKKDSLLNAIAAEPMKDSHIGDLNNLVADENGEATVDIKFSHSPRPSLFEGDTNILRRTLVIHAGILTRISQRNSNHFKPQQCHD